MQQESSARSAISRAKKSPTVKWVFVTVFIVAGVVGIFGLGVGVGSGRISFSTLDSQNEELPTSLNYSSVTQVYNSLRANYDGKLDQTKLLDGMKAGLVNAAGDPYTEYFDAKSADEFNSQLSGTFSGIGAELGQDAQNNLVIVAPIDGTPASKAGLRPQDIITEINGKSTTGMSVDQAVTKIRGEKGTKVTLKLVREKSQALTLTITRDDIKVPSVKSEIMDGNIGYLKINQFGADTAELAQKAAQDFKDKNVKGVVLDMRGNPGGLLTAAVDISSLWLPQGQTILQEKRGSTVVSTETATGNDILKGIPTAVLIDEGSASASEITAGALHDNNVATLFGVKSYGKGSVQQVIKLPGGTEMKVTIARWYRPNGQNIDKKGITPENIVKMTADDFKAGNDLQKNAAVKFIQDKQ
ncbi:MAG TPA: S41 family peptidase [Candidatus Saccharimonadales bacterium]|nr:S41 family peptidase [Candidatus Saccharimonadales bacterium]